MAFYRRYNGLEPRIVDAQPAGVGPTLPASGPMFPPVPLEVQVFSPRTAQDYSKPAMLDPRTAASFVTSRPVVDVPRWLAPGIITPKPEGQVMTFPSPPITQVMPPDMAPDYQRPDLPPYSEQPLETAVPGGVPIAWVPDGLEATVAPPRSNNGLAAAAAGAAGGFALGGGLGALVGAAAGFFLGRK